MELKVLKPKLKALKFLSKKERDREREWERSRDWLLRERERERTMGSCAVVFCASVLVFLR